MKKLKVEYVALDKIIPYANNPRNNEMAVDNVVASIKEFGFKNPIILDKENVIVAGHTRFLASRRLELESVPCIYVDDLTPQQIKAYRIADNKTAEFSIWDMEKLEIELQGLDDMFTGFDDDFFDELEGASEQQEKTPGSLTERFIVPPFSVLDTRQGYWQKRKRKWLEITGNLSETRDGEFGTVSGGQESMFATINGGTSNFDPVLAEVMYKWFNVPNGKILDPFGGEQTKGVVAGYLGYKYVAVEFRKEQVDTNMEKVKEYPGVVYHTGDSNNISKIIPDRDFDFCFTSPPYYDLEIYSKEDMSALGSYEQFMEQYKNIFEQCYSMMKNDRFMVLKVAEIRDKKTGEYRNFVRDNLKIMEEIGFKYYNDIVLVNAIGTAPMRANNSMANRKIVKVHQNVLVFYKGDLKNIQNNFDTVLYDDDDVFDEFTENTEPQGD